MNKKLIGKHINSTESKSEDWAGRWPIIDRLGIITGIHAGDEIPEDATLVNWSTNTTRGRCMIVDGDNGFEAVLDPDDVQSVMRSTAAAALGEITSERKSKSSAANGKLGGRPKKIK